MTFLLLIVLAWMGLAALICIVVCMGAGRFEGFDRKATTASLPPLHARRHHATH